jgi:hypothetical protein
MRKNELNFIASRPIVCNYGHFAVTMDIWYVYNTELRIYGHMSVKLVFITQATDQTLCNQHLCPQPLIVI